MFYCRPNNYEEVLNLARAYLQARLDTRPGWEWRIEIRRDEGEKLDGVEISHTKTGKTRVERLNQMKHSETNNLKDRALLHQMEIEELQRLNRRPGAGRRNRSDGGTDNDLEVYTTVTILTGLGWQKSRNETSEETSAFDAVADVMRELRATPASYTGIREAYYRVKNSF